MIISDYVEGYTLKENEYMLKLRDNQEYDSISRTWFPSKNKTGFLTKFNKDGSMPKAFNDWGKTYQDRTPLPTYIFEETFRSGWKILNWRFGKSQNWATIRHPEGFTLEIYLQQFLEIVKTEIIDEGHILGEYKWEDHKLIKKS